MVLWRNQLWTLFTEWIRFKPLNHLQVQFQKGWIFLTDSLNFLDFLRIKYQKHVLWRGGPIFWWLLDFKVGNSFFFFVTSAIRIRYRPCIIKTWLLYLQHLFLLYCKSYKGQVLLLNYKTICIYTCSNIILLWTWCW